MNRRAFLAGLTLAGAPCPFALAATPKTIGWLTFFGVGEEDLILDTVNALGVLGWKRGETLQLTRSIPLKPAEIDGAADELVSLRPDLIIVHGEAACAAIQSRSKSLPLLFYNSFDPVRSGIVQSHSQPGGQATGLIGYPISLGPKWVQLLQTLVPDLRQLALVYEPTIAAAQPLIAAIKAYAASTHTEVVSWDAGHFGSIEGATRSFPDPYPQAILAIPDPITIRVRRNLTVFAVRQKIPAMFWYSDAVRANALISYGPDRRDLPSKLADRINRILRGTAPASMPLEEPTRYELAINRLVASEFGVEISPLLAAQADVFIE